MNTEILLKNLIAGPRWGGGRGEGAELEGDKRGVRV